ncbi:MAG: biotin synthase BioB [Nitrospirae bacterium]|nr:biotin synthase BioB [Nitrospirota bacterium]
MVLRSDTENKDIFDALITGEPVPDDTVVEFISTSPIHQVFALASELRARYRGNKVDLCSIINAKSGKCPEDCKYCAQSIHYQTGAESYGLLDRERILEQAREAKKWGAKRFCIVTSGKRPSPKELERIADCIASIKEIGLLPCATLGILSREDLQLLKEAGLNRYHHNLETSRSFFPEVCSTHSYDEKLKTIEAVKELGLSLCCGGIFGLGEDWQHRMEMARELKRIGPDSVPINFLIPIKGTPLGRRPKLNPVEALRVVALFRIVLPDAEVRVCGGRLQVLGEFNSMIFMAGADGLLVGNYLTQPGRVVEDDLRIIRAQGLSY